MRRLRVAQHGHREPVWFIIVGQDPGSGNGQRDIFIHGVSVVGRIVSQVNVVGADESVGGVGAQHGAVGDVAGGGDRVGGDGGKHQGGVAVRRHDVSLRKGHDIIGGGGAVGGRVVDDGTGKS